QTEREKSLSEFQVKQKMLAQARRQAIFMNCLLAQRGVEVTSGVRADNQSGGFVHSDNRLHAQKAWWKSIMSYRSTSNCQHDSMFFKDVHVIILGMVIFFYVHFQSLYMVEGKRASFHFVTGVSEYYYFLSVSFALSLCRGS